MRNLLLTILEVLGAMVFETINLHLKLCIIMDDMLLYNQIKKILNSHFSFLATTRGFLTASITPC